MVYILEQNDFRLMLGTYGKKNRSGVKKNGGSLVLQETHLY